MAFPERLLHILAGPRRSSHCRYCGRPIEWATTAPRGKVVPLNPNPFVLRYERNAGGVKFLVIGADNLHFVTCTKRPAKPTRMRIFGGRPRA